MMPRLVGSVLLALACAATALGDCYAPVIVHQQTVFTTPVVATFVPVIVPAYSITYADPGASLKAENDRLRAELDTLRAPAPRKMPAAAELPPPAAASDAFAVFKGECASCHDKAVSATKGGKQAFLDGDRVLDLDAGQALAIMLHVMKGTMPPGRPLPEAKKIAVANLFELKK